MIRAEREFIKLPELTEKDATTFETLLGDDRLDYPRRKVILGGSDPVKFAPNVNASMHEDEFWLNINFADLQVASEQPTILDGKVEIKIGDITFFSYVLPGTEGVLEAGFVLDKKIAFDAIRLPLQHSGNLSFEYQGPLPQAFIDRGDYRPPNVVGSYAVYGNKMHNQYKNGKICHLYRWECIDRDGKKAWCDELKIENDVLIIGLPDTWLKTARYPVTVMGSEDTFGFTGTPGSSQDLNNFNGGFFNSGGAGNVITLSCYIACSGDEANMGIYDGTSGDVQNNIGSATAQRLTNGTETWIDWSADIDINDDDYWLCVNNERDEAVATVYYDSASGHDFAYGLTVTYDTWPDNPSGGSYSNGYRFGVHADYAAGGGDIETSQNQGLAVAENITIAMQGPTINISQGVAVAEQISIAMPLGAISVADGIGTTEGIGPDVPLGAVTGIDNITIAELLQLLKDLTPAVFDNIGLQEFIEILAGDINIDISDTVGLAEYLAAIMDGLAGSAGEDVALGEFLNAAMNVLASRSETIGIGEAVTVIMRLLCSAVQAVAVTESIEIALQGELGDVTINQLVALAENIAARLDLAGVSVAQGLGLAETITAATVMLTSGSESVGISEAITLIIDLVASAAETVGISENIVAELEGVLGAVARSETIALMETIQAELEEVVGPINVSEVIGTVENISAALALPDIEAADAVAVMETIAAAIPLATTIGDVIGIAEYIAVNMPAAASLAETMSITENISVRFDKILLQRIETLAVSEYISVIVSGIVGAVSMAFSALRPGQTYSALRPGQTYSALRPGMDFDV